jgi:hypothetical protein
MNAWSFMTTMDVQTYFSRSPPKIPTENEAEKKEK